MIGLRVLLFNRAIARVGRSRLDYQARTAVRGLEGVMTLKNQVNIRDCKEGASTEPLVDVPEANQSEEGA